ncbi:MAG TPA: hypothetical protein VFW22_17300 [Pseudolabrys sp.]|nr:hypothetical protein [Pseudolabrys sp.]
MSQTVKYACSITVAAFAATLAIATFALPRPAHAIDGRTAVGACIDSTASGARCSWSVNDKGEIDICDKSGCTYCKSADSECVAAARKGRPHPTTGLPPGTTITTAVGTFKVSPNHSKGPILQLRCPQGFRICAGHSGCISNHDDCTPIK